MAGPAAAHDQRDRAQLDHRAVPVHLGLPRRPARGHHHQRLVQRLVGGAQARRDHAELGTDQVGGQAEAAVGRLRVRAGVDDLARLAQPEQGGHRLQIVLHPVVDLPDRGVLGHQLALAAAQFGDVPHQHQGAGPAAAHDQRDRPQLDHRAVPVHLGLARGAARGHHHERIVQRFVRGDQARRDHAELGSDQVGGQAEAAVGGLRVRAGVDDPAGLAQPEQPVADARRPDQHGVGAGERERPLGHHPGQVVGALQVGELKPARGPGRVQVGAPLDDRDHPVRPGHRDPLGAHRDAVRPVRVALPPDAPLVPGHVEHPLVLRPGEGADHVVLERGGAGGGAHLGDRQPAGAVLGRRPQDQVGEGQVGQELPVRHQRVQVLDVRFAQACVASGQVVQGGHRTIIASGAEIIPACAIDHTRSNCSARPPRGETRPEYDAIWCPAARTTTAAAPIRSAVSPSRR